MGKHRPFPSRPVDRLTKPFVHFMHIEATSGIVLLVSTLIALVAANTALEPAYNAFWATDITVGVGAGKLSYPLWYWINDALMAVFFFVIGLEIKRELVTGELQEPKKIVLPIVAAVGGAVVPVAIFMALQPGGGAERGWAIPMATDIAFVVGCIALLGPRVPHGLKVFLLSLAIVDDLLAVLVIAIFYSANIHITWLIAALGGLTTVLMMQRAGIRSVGLYILVGVAVWFCTYKSGLHPTIAGVALGLLTPARRYLDPEVLDRAIDRARDGLKHLGDDPAAAWESLADLSVASRESVSPLVRLEHALHPWVAFLIMPVFAMANAAVPIVIDTLVSPLSLAIALGLFVGKPVGITLSAFLAVKMRAAALPEGVTWGAVIGGGTLSGIGFTMALFIAGLGITDPVTLVIAKQGILLGSLAAAVVGMVLLARVLPRAADTTPE